MNRMHAEIFLKAGGRRYPLCLTLGALAEIQDGLGLTDLSQIAPRMEHLRAADLAIVTGALIRGGGGDITPAEVLRLPCPLPDMVAAVSAVFAAAGPAEEATEAPASGPFAGPS